MARRVGGPLEDYRNPARQHLAFLHASTRRRGGGFWEGETTACTLAQAQPLLLRCNPWQTALQPGEPSAQPPMSQSAQCGPDSGAAQPASAPGGVAHVSTNSAEQPGSRDSADGSVEQPAMSASRVQQPATLNKCWLCARRHSIDALQTLQTLHLPAPVLQCIVERYSRTAMPLICSACKVFISIALRFLGHLILNSMNVKVKTKPIVTELDT